MPFIMRRMKGDVLRELPEKIINDYYCSLTESQIRHYSRL
jgi:TATA-binding protein-associated factor